MRREGQHEKKRRDGEEEEDVAAGAEGYRPACTGLLTAALMSLNQ